MTGAPLRDDTDLDLSLLEKLDATAAKLGRLTKQAHGVRHRQFSPRAFQSAQVSVRNLKRLARRLDADPPSTDG